MCEVGCCNYKVLNVGDKLDKSCITKDNIVACVNGEIVNYNLSSFESFTLLLFYPADWSFICPTELIELNKNYREFTERNCNVYGVSTDSVYSHIAYTSAEAGAAGIGKLNYPLIDDSSLKLSKTFGVLQCNKFSYRSAVIIKNNTVMYKAIHHDSISRSVDELLRILDILIATNGNSVCPAKWKKGDKLIPATAKGIQEHIKTLKN